MDLSKIIQGKKLTETEEAILKYIITHIDSVLEQGVRTVAKENFTSPATVMRLSKKLGYNGFIDLYYHLEPMVRGTKSVFLSEDYVLEAPTAYEEAVCAFIELINSLGDKNIFIYATGFSGIVGEYMYKKLLVNGQRALFASGTDSIGILENNLHLAGLFVTITKSVETKQVIEKMAYFKGKGVPIITFTNDLDNAASRLADIVFQIPTEDRLDDRNIKSNYFFVHALYIFENIMRAYQEK